MTISSGQGPSSTYDEAFCPDGSTRPGYGELIPALTGVGILEARERLDRHLSAAGVGFGDDAGPYPVDPLPRLIANDEWARVSAGLAQRQTAMNAFLDDAYGERTLLDQGVMPGRVIEESRYFEPLVARPQVRAGAAIAGPDLIRDSSGDLLVVEDNLRTPSGIAYAVACRRAIRASGIYPGVRELDPARIAGRLIRSFRSAIPPARDEPSIAMLSDGPRSKAWFEHREIADWLRIPVVQPGDLESRRGSLFGTVDGRQVEFNVLYNRSSEESLRDPDGGLSDLGELLEEPLMLGNLGSVNSFGAGLADDKAVHCYADDLIRFYLDEQPILSSVPGLDLGQPEQLEVALGQLDELVIKPRWSFGGQGIVMGPQASASELEEVRARLDEAPADYVAQPTIDLSVHPTAVGPRLEPRHVDLRAFVLSVDGASSALPVALTRYAGEAGELVVNSTQGGGAKDTWLLARDAGEIEGDQ